jgi:hypothetical protein
MIRRMDNHPATIDQLRRRARLKAWAAEQWAGRPDCETCGVDCGGRCAREVGAHTEIRLCVVCKGIFALGTHDDLGCARTRGLRPGDVYVLEHAAPRCGAGCGAKVTSEGAWCIRCTVDSP